jgi:hypothetical protein
MWRRWAPERRRREEAEIAEVTAWLAESVAALDARAGRGDCRPDCGPAVSASAGAGSPVK